MPQHPRFIGLVCTVFIVVLALCLGACGGPDTSEDFGEAVVSAGQPIAVGVSVALTGDASGDAQAIERGVRLAVEQTGAIKSHPLAVEVRDDGCSAEGSVAVARAFGERDDVAGVIGPMCSSGCVPASLVYDDAKVLMLTPSCTASVLTGQVLDTVVRLAWNGEAAAIGGAKFAAGQLKAERIYAINDSTFYGKQQRDAFKETLKQRGGTLIADEYVQSQDWDFTDLVADIKAKAPDAIYYAGFLPAGRFLIQQVRYHGIAAPFIGADALLDEDAFIRESNTAAQGAYLTDARSVEGKQYERFARAFRERWGSDPGPWSAQAYDAAVVLIEALEKTADRRDGGLVVDRKALRDAVLRTDRQGASGKIQFWPNGERKYADAVVAVIKQVDGDQFRAVREYELD
jgi:ABC-type branched-subunit amino acid transport system substrate-binding protein